MSYIKPSPLVYQDLLNSGGVLNSTPDLESCIIGPVNQVLSYVPGSTASQIKTAAYSSTSTTGTITKGSEVLVVVSTGGLSVGDTVLVEGAGASGATLQATVTDIQGNQVSLDTIASTAVTSGLVTKSGSISNAAISNTFVLPGQKPGQIVDASSVKVWFNNTKVETLTTGVSATANSSVINVMTASTTGAITSGQASLVVASAKGLRVGDYVTVVGAGASGNTLTAKITNIVGTTVSVTPSAGTTVSGAAVVKVQPINLNSTTNTLRIEAGDEIHVSYTDSYSVAQVLTTYVRSVVTSQGNNGTLTSINLVDALPSYTSIITTGSISSGSSTLALGSATGIVVGTSLTIRGAGASGADLVAKVNSISGTDATLNTAASTTVSGAGVLSVNEGASVSVRKTYNNQQVASVKPISGGNSLDVSNVGTTGQIVVLAGPELVYGPVVSADVYIGYKAQRTDLSNQVLTFNDLSEVIGTLGEISSDNPLALGLKIALQNTTGRIRAIAVSSNDSTGYTEALTAAEGERLYALVPLTQDESIIATFKAHALQLSTPENASWRVAIVNTAIPTKQNIGTYSSGYVNSNSGNSTITTISGKRVLTVSNATFITDGVIPGDTVVITAATPSNVAGQYQVLEVVNNQQLVLNTSLTATAVSYYVSRNMTKTQSATAVKLKSEVFGTQRIWHVQPDIVGVTINGVVEYLPGYYLACGLSGMSAGFPVQQGFTNIGVAGISDLKHSNFYFSKQDLNSMAETGTCIFVQDTQGGIPYCRHELTTDVTALEYREILVVKNWDFLSYFYYDKLKGFMGSWNITPDTINTIRQTLTASSELLKGKKLPKIGAPLLGYSIVKLEQNKYNKDNLDAQLNIAVVYPLNYLNLHLVI